MADPVNDLVGTAIRSWATLARAWIDGATSLFFGLVELGESESELPGFNEEVVAIQAHGAPTGLELGRFADADDRTLDPECVTVSPETVATEKATSVSIRVAPAPGTTSGTYTGSPWNSEQSECLAEGVQIYVVGDRLP